MSKIAFRGAKGLLDIGNKHFGSCDHYRQLQNKI